MDTDPNLWIRLLDNGSGSGPDPALFFRDFTKNILSILTVGTFTSIFIDSKSLRSHKRVNIEVFIKFFVLFMK